MPLPGGPARPAGQRAQFGLTAREACVGLECLKGGTREQLADRLDVSDSTVRTHLPRITKKNPDLANSRVDRASVPQRDVRLSGSAGFRCNPTLGQ